jgi:hypothetical protein
MKPKHEASMSDGGSDVRGKAYSRSVSESEEPPIAEEEPGSDRESIPEDLDAEANGAGGEQSRSALSTHGTQLADAFAGRDLLGAKNLEMIRRTLDVYQWPIVDLHRQFTSFTMQPVVADLMRNLNIVNTIGAAAFPQLKILDGITPSFLRSAELAQTFRISQVVIGDSALSTWRSALIAQDHIREILGPMAVLHEHMAAAVRPLVLDIAAVSDASVRLSEWAAELDAGRRAIGIIAAPAFARWQQSVAGLDSTASVQPWRFAGASGHGALSLLAADTKDDSVDDLTADLATVVDAEVVETWTDGHVRWQEDLLGVAGDLDPQVPELLRGAWDDVHRQGPAAISKICNCLVEALDRALRAAAPDDEVRSWFEAAKRPASEWDAGRRRPTRALRIRYVVHVRQIDGGDVIEAQAEALIVMNRALMGDAQSAKHTSTATMARVRSLLVAAEALLSMLFCG